MEEALETVESVARPFLTTPFSDYSVTEGLLLLLVLSVVVSWIFKLLKGGFSWLL